MAKNKTTETNSSVAAYLKAITADQRREDCKLLVDIFSEETGFEPKMWGTSIVGFGSYHYKYDSGHEGDAPLAGLSSRANAIVMYLADDYEKREELLGKLGKHKLGKVCVYIQKLSDVDVSVLKKMIRNSFKRMKELYPSKK